VGTRKAETLSTHPLRLRRARHKIASFREVFEDTMALAVMRRHKRWLFIFLWLVIATFILYFVPAFQGSTGAGTPGEVLARVGGAPITVGEYQAAYRNVAQFYERFQGRLDPATRRRMGLERQAFDSLVEERLVELEARRVGLSVSDETLARSIATDPRFQQDGRYMGPAAIRRWLQLQGRTEADFERAERRRVLAESLEGLVTDSVTVSDDEVEREFRRRNEQVKVEYVLADAARFRPQVTVSDDELKARFDKDKESYRFPEKRVLSYILLDPETLRTRVSVTDREIESYYREHPDEFRQDAEVCASHVLVKVKASPDAKDGHPDAEAKAMAEKILAQARGGADFAELARKSSEDVGSAPSGGDLGCFGRGRMVPEFDQAVFSLEPGQISDVVKTSFGYHVIRLGSVKEEGTLPLAGAKERIRQMVTMEKVETLAAQKAEALAKLLGKGRKLEEAAKEEGLTLQKTAPFSRGEPPPPLTSPTLASRAFEMKAGDVEKEGFSLPRGAAFIALADIQPSRVPELKEVQDKLRADLVEERAFEKAKEAAEQLKAKATATTLDKAAAALGLVRKETQALTGHDQPLGDLGTSALLEAQAFSLPEKSLSDPVRVPAGYAVMRVLEKKAFDPAEFAKQKGSIATSLRQQKKNELFQSYMSQARERVTIYREPEAYKRVVTAAR
jgi:peptidyl-prolyl cis-trans isomerase D